MALKSAKKSSPWRIRWIRRKNFLLFVSFPRERKYLIIAPFFSSLTFSAIVAQENVLSHHTEIDLLMNLTCALRISLSFFSDIKCILWDPTNGYTFQYFIISNNITLLKNIQLCFIFLFAFWDTQERESTEKDDDKRKHTKISFSIKIKASSGRKRRRKKVFSLFLNKNYSAHKRFWLD